MSLPEVYIPPEIREHMAGKNCEINHIGLSGSTVIKKSPKALKNSASGDFSY